jgi:hypothetical protein
VNRGMRHMSRAAPSPSPTIVVAPVVATEEAMPDADGGWHGPSPGACTVRANAQKPITSTYSAAAKAAAASEVDAIEAGAVAPQSGSGKRKASPGVSGKAEARAACVKASKRARHVQNATRAAIRVDRLQRAQRCMASMVNVPPGVADAGSTGRGCGSPEEETYIWADSQEQWSEHPVGQLPPVGEFVKGGTCTDVPLWVAN